MFGDASTSGTNLIQAKGGFGHLYGPPRPEGEAGDPPSPHPWRCMDVGAAIAEVLAKSPYQTTLMNAACAVSWIAYFCALKALEPSLAQMLCAGMGPIIRTVTGATGTSR